MRRRNRKHRKPIQETQNRTIVTKGNSTDNMLSGKGQMRPYFTAKISESIPSCQFSILIKNKKSETKENGKRKRKKEGPDSDWFENNFFMPFPSSKKSSIAFFIPLKDCICEFNKNDDFTNLMNWNSLLFYESHSSSMISQYNLSCKSNSQDKSVVSQFRKGRSSSESSINSEDSFICFEIEDYSEKNDEIDYFNNNNDSFSSETDVPLDTTKSGKKKVRFADNSELATVHVIIAWDFAYRAARVSPWEVVARDANRFKLKIQSLEPLISSVLNPEHRSKIWHSRMERFYN